jgi:hypothetical protein
VGDDVARTIGAESPAYRATTLNQRRPTRAKSAPAQARIVRFQAVNSGFAAQSARSDQRAESRSTVRKTAQESQKSAHPGETRLCGRLDFKTVNIWLCEAKKVQADVGA